MFTRLWQRLRAWRDGEAGTAPPQRFPVHPGDTDAPDSLDVLIVSQEDGPSPALSPPSPPLSPTAPLTPPPLFEAGPTTPQPAQVRLTEVPTPARAIEPPALPQRGTGRAARLPRTRPRILIVDDDLRLCQMMRPLLEQAGYDVVMAHTAEDAYSRVMYQLPDLTIADINLPGMNGYRLVRRFRQQTRTRVMPILMLTGRDDIFSKVEGFEAGIDDYLSKPFHMPELLYRVRNLLAHSSGATPRDQAGGEGRGRVIVVFGSKGGVGKTTIAVNLAVALRQRVARDVALFDADFAFGDVGVHLNLAPGRTAYDLIPFLPTLPPSRQALATHTSGIHVLIGSGQPDQAMAVTGAQVQALLAWLSASYSFVIVDCPVSYDERTRVLLDQADDLLLVTTPEIGPLKNMSLFLQLAQKQGFPLENSHIILNRADSQVGIGAEAIERTLRHQITFRIISAGRSVSMSINRGVPLVAEQPNHPLSRQLFRIAELLATRIQGISVRPEPPVLSETPTHP